MGQDLRTLTSRPINGSIESGHGHRSRKGLRIGYVSSFWIHYLYRIRSEWLEIANAYIDSATPQPVAISEDPVLENACGLMKTLTNRPIANQRSGSGNYLPTTRPARSLRLGHGRKHRVFDSQKLHMYKLFRENQWDLFRPRMLVGSSLVRRYRPPARRHNMLTKGKKQTR